MEIRLFPKAVVSSLFMHYASPAIENRSMPSIRLPLFPTRSLEKPTRSLEKLEISVTYENSRAFTLSPDFLI
jgi:hypothetical protein